MAGTTMTRYCVDRGGTKRKSSQPRCPACRVKPQTCPQCNQESTPNFEGQKACSRKCNMGKINSDPEHQRVYGKLGGAVRGQQLEAEARGVGYKKRDGLHIHRTVAEFMLDRPLEPGEIVHHEDLNKRNNHPSNLIVFPSQSVHASHHFNNHCGSPCDCPGIRLKDIEL